MIIQRIPLIVSDIYGSIDTWQSVLTNNSIVMNKIVIEVTSDGWETTVTINGKEYKEKHVATAFGSESVEGNFESEDDIPEEIYDALNSSFPFECMQALYVIED